MMKTQRLNWGLVAILSLVIQACVSQDTTGDNTQHEINRQNEVANQIEKQYSPMKGRFEGNYNFSKIVLNLDVVRVNSTGNGDLGLVPLPNLVGSLEVIPAVFVDDKKNYMDINYPVIDGQYVNDNDLTLHVQVNGSPTVFHCKMNNGALYDCDWYTLASESARASFQLSHVSNNGKKALDPASHALNGKGKFYGHYEGSSKDYVKIVADIRLLLSTQSGSVSVPVISVAEDFTFYSEELGWTNAPSMDGAFDPISSTFAAKIQGDNPIVVDCTVTSEVTLHCIWNGRHGKTSFEEFDLTETDSL